MPLYGPANPVSSGAVLLCWMGFGGAMLRSRMLAGETPAAKRDLHSSFGIALQGVGIALSWVGPFRFGLPVRPTDWIAAIPPAAVALGAISLFAWSTQTMGANWSLLARTREDHSLVQTGPFALVRNPIYVALFGMMCALAIALGHAVNLLLAIPIYVVGTLMRVSIEERLLREMFGQAFDDYARRVKRFVPLIW
jgi:protein-S-isoprenylcysteine O-methyltransferase Ste14